MLYVRSENKRFFRPFVAMMVAGVLALSLQGCDMAENNLKTDREAALDMQDYRDSLASRVGTESDTDTKGDPADIPELQPYISSSGERMKSMPLVSVTVDQSVSLRDALYELSKEAGYDIELDPRIKGGIIFSAKERPFDEVVARIADVAGLRYKFENDVLRVELDTPYNKVYKIDYLSYIRNNKSGVSNDLSVSSSGDGGVKSGSNFQTSSESESDFWGELETNLEQIVRGNQTGALKTKKEPKITATEKNPPVQATAPAGADGKTSAGGEDVKVQPPEAVLKVESLPEDEGEDSATSDSGGGSEESEGRFTLNKQAGLINIYATEKAQKEVEHYLKLLRRAVTSQVMIEAKVLEVTLSDEYATGIDWAMNPIFKRYGISFGSDSVAPTVASEGANDPIVLSYDGQDFSALINAVSAFGTVKALASPRLTVLNNQAAVLNVSTNRVYFELDLTVTAATDTEPRSVEVESDAKSVPEGVLINVQPSINLDDQTISLALRPSVTKINSYIEDPGTAFVAAEADIDISNRIPEVNVQEVDSVIQTRSGQPIVMGGLLQDRTDTSESGIPVLSEVPMMGNLFKNHTDTVSKTELVIFLKATILDNPSDTVDDTDKDLYRQFSSDRRPFKL